MFESIILSEIVARAKLSALAKKSKIGVLRKIEETSMLELIGNYYFKILRQNILLA